jgi:Restriction endonuclease
MSRKSKKLSHAPKPWKEFEQAVTAFLKSLLKDDPNAVVRFNPPKIDRDTKEKQQVDAWIDYRVGGHLPIKILISCKDHVRKIDVGGIRTFIQEIADSGASTGALYSQAGFTKGAVTKASAHGVGCFQLWHDRPADRPAIEIFRRYWCWDSVRLPIVEPGESGFSPKTWDEFFDFHVVLDGQEQTLGEYLEEALHKGKDLAVKQVNATKMFEFPEDFVCSIDLPDCPGRSTKITVECRWLRYQGKLCASLLNGSYCVGTGHFTGTVSMPLPVTYPPPASDWELLPSNLAKNSNVKSVLFTKNSNGLITEMKKRLAGRPMPVWIQP